MIVNAAIRKNGIVYTGTRHAYILHHPDRPLGFLFDGEQGFVTDTGEFVDREDGAIIAYSCCQIAESKDELFSEDLIKADQEEMRIFSEFVTKRSLIKEV